VKPIVEAAEYMNSKVDGLEKEVWDVVMSKIK